MTPTRRPSPPPASDPAGVPTAILPRPDPVRAAYRLEMDARAKVAEAKRAAAGLDASQRHRLATMLLGGSCDCGAFTTRGRAQCLLCEIDSAL